MIRVLITLVRVLIMLLRALIMTWVTNDKGTDHAAMFDALAEMARLGANIGRVDELLLRKCE